MGLDYNFPNPNKKVIDSLVADFARNSAENAEKSQKSVETRNGDGGFLTVVREMDDGYVVRFAYTESKALGRTEKTDFIGRELFESCVKSGYLTKIEEKGE